MLQTVLLDTRIRGRRVLQVLSQSMFVPLMLLGLSMLARPTFASTSTGVLVLSACALIAFFEIRFPLGSTVEYKGHRIRFHNHAVFGERLYIDGVLTDRGRVGSKVTLRGTIESGAGAGERITAQVGTHFTQVTCRIVAESFAAATITASETV